MFSAQVKILHDPAHQYDEQRCAAERRAALEIIRDAAERCHVEDMRTPKVYEALNRLNDCVTPNRSYVFRRFRRVLEIDDPFNRSASATLAYETISSLIS